MDEADDLEHRYKAAKETLQNQISDPLKLSESQPGEYMRTLERLQQEVEDLERRIKSVRK